MCKSEGASGTLPFASYY